MRTLNIKAFIIALLLSLGVLAANAQLTFTLDQVGTEGVPGSFTPNADPGSYTVVGGGNDTWDVSDNLTFVHTTVSGDFDFRVRLESIQNTDRWSKAGINARESLEGPSRCVFQRITPFGACTHDGDGANDNLLGYRTWLKDSAGPNGGQHEDFIDNFSLAKWVRLRRVGNVFYGYASRDGLNWGTPLSQNSATWAADPTVDVATVARKAMAQDLEVGFSVSSHWVGETATVEFRDFGSPNWPVQFSRQPADFQVELVGKSADATFDFGVPGGFDFLGIQWFKDDLSSPIPGATGPVLKLAATLNDDGSAFFVMVTNRNDGSWAESAHATLTIIPDISAPTLVSAESKGTPSWVVLKFSEAMDGGTLNPGFFALDNGASCTKAWLGSTTDAIVLEVAGLVEGTLYTVTVNGALDQGGNAAMGQSATFTMVGEQRIPLTPIHIFRWNSIAGGGTANLLASPLYPDNPDDIYSNTLFEDTTPDDDTAPHNNFSARLFGLYNCDETGDYQFFVCSDDNSTLYLSTDDSMGDKVKIAIEPSWNSARNYFGTEQRNATSPENRSPVIHLEAGRQYYMETVFGEGGGGNNCSVAVKRPGGSNPSLPIPDTAFVATRYLNGTFFQNFGLATVAQGPVSQTVQESGFATLTMQPDGTPPYMIQWYKNGVAVAGATDRTVTTPRLIGQDMTDWKNANVTVCVSNELGGACSAAAVLTIQADAQAPTLASIEPSPDGAVILNFSEPVTKASAIIAANYSVKAGTTSVAPSTATLLSDTMTVKLTFATPLQADTIYTLTVKDLKDRAVVANVISPNPSTGTFKTFVGAVQGLVVREWWYNAPGGYGNLAGFLNYQPLKDGKPDFVDTLTTFNSPQTAPDMDNYGARMTGYLIPPVSGNYKFSWYSDDSGHLLVSTNSDPAGASVVVEEPNCCNTLYSGTVTLMAGRPYFVQAIFKEASGGDVCEVKWQLPGANSYVWINSANIWSAFRLDNVVQPADLAVEENCSASFSVQATGSMLEGLTRQWFSNDVAVAGATGWTYTSLITPLSANNALYHLELGAGGQVFYKSANAKLTVNQDQTPPTLATVYCSPDLKSLTFVYSEAMDPGTATSAASYGLSASDGGSAIVLVDPGVQSADMRSITFATTEAYRMDKDYHVMIAGIKDLANNVVNLDQTWHSCIPSVGWARYEVYTMINNTPVSDLTSNAKYPNSPDLTGYISGFDSRLFFGDDSHDNYGARMRAFFIAPESGDYTFYTKSDDASELWFGADFANLARITQQTGCCNGNWTDIASPPQTLQAGKIYALQMLYKEGGGGDYGQVAVKLPSYVGDANALPTIPNYLFGWVDTQSPDVQLAITKQLTDVSTCEQKTVTFQGAATVTGTALTPVYSWQKSTDGGVTWMPLAGGMTYTTAALTAADDGAKYRYIVSVGANYAISASAKVSVSPAGAVLGALPTFNMVRQSSLVQVGVLFSKAMDAMVLDPSMYTLSGGISVVAAEFDDATSTKVTLQVSVMAKDTAYTLTVSPTVADATGQPLCGVNTVSFKTPNGVAGIDFTQPLALQGGRIVNGGSSPGPYAQDGVLHMTDAVNSQQGGFYWDPFGDALIQGFVVSFNLRIGEGTCCSGRFADGMSMSFAADLPDPPTGFAAEDGAGTGVIVGFDTWDNLGTDTAPALDIKSGGNADANIKAFQAFDGIRDGGRAFAGPLINDPASGEPMTMWSYGAYVPFRMQLKSDGTMNVGYKGVDILTNVQTGYVPVAGAKFLFSARTGGANENAWIKDLVIESIEQADRITFTYALDATDPAKLVLTWTSLSTGTTTLEEAPSLSGPWTEVTGATSPYTLPMSGAMKFYRIKNQ
jgi:hypothetical protein